MFSKPSHCCGDMTGKGVEGHREREGGGLGLMSLEYQMLEFLTGCILEFLIISDGLSSLKLLIQRLYLPAFQEWLSACC